MKILTIIGARPQIIKAAALSRAIKNHFADKIQEKILHTGQHYDANMSGVFFEELGIPSPDFNLQVGSDSHGQQTAKMIAGIEQVLLAEHFDAIVLYGDTNSTLAGAVAASKIHLPIVHIEAGLRSFNMAMPEEVNRIVCDQLSTLLFAPTATGIKNLENEGFFTSTYTFKNGLHRTVFNSGDIMYDNSMYFASIAEQKTSILSEHQLKQDGYLLATIHRDANTDNPVRLSAIFDALSDIAAKDKIQVIIPLHPRTAKLLSTNLSPVVYAKVMNLDGSQNENTGIKIIEPASFLEMIALEKNAKMVITDSGGVQKEAYYFEKPCIILRPETEWVEIVEQEAGIIADADKAKIIEAYQVLSNRKIEFKPIFGDSKASEFILDKMLTYLRVK